MALTTLTAAASLHPSPDLGRGPPLAACWGQLLPQPVSVYPSAPELRIPGSRVCLESASPTWLGQSLTPGPAVTPCLLCCPHHAPSLTRCSPRAAGRSVLREGAKTPSPEAPSVHS